MGCAMTCAPSARSTKLARLKSLQHSGPGQQTVIAYMPQQAQFALLSEFQPPWGQFDLSLGAQSLTVVMLAWLAVLHPAVLSRPARDYHFVRLVRTPTLINH